MKFETYLDKRHEWRWRLKASNGKIIADSGEGYKQRSDCLHGIDLVRQTKSFTELFVLKTININSKAPQGFYFISIFNERSLFLLSLAFATRVSGIVIAACLIYAPITNRDYFVSFGDYFIDLQRNLFLKKMIDC